MNELFRAQARVRLAELSAEPDPATATRAFDAFDAAWPLADADHPLVRRAAAVRAGLTAGR